MMALVGGDFARFEHHRAAGGEGGGDLADDLVKRPVPGGDEGGDAGGLAGDQGGAARVVETVGFEDLRGFFQMGEANPGLGAVGEFPGGAEFAHDGVGQVVHVACVDGDDAVQQGEALGAQGGGVGGEGFAGGGYSAIDVGVVGQRDLGDGLFGGWVDDGAARSGERGRPAAADVELGGALHGGTPGAGRAGAGSFAGARGGGNARRGRERRGR